MRDATVTRALVLGAWILCGGLVPGCGAGDELEIEGSQVSPGGFATADVDVPVGDVEAEAPGPDAGTSEHVGCKSSDECAGLLEVGPCESAACEVSSGECVLTPRADGTSCGEGDPCLSAAACAQGVCIGQETDCDDGDPCTDDSCAPGSGCLYAYNEAPCDDGDACTTGDVCLLGSCESPQVLDCDDGNVCTSDSCDVIFGCQYAPTSTLCDDGDPCTSGDVCSNGTCQGQADDSAPNCNATCGNGSCGAGETCETCPSDCGPCATCPEGQMVDCLAGCTEAASYGNGQCDEALNCLAKQYDGGDCAPSGECEDGQIKDCADTCAAAWPLGDGTCNAQFDCTALNFDNGDCVQTGECGPGQINACDGSCVAEWQIGDGTCNPSLDCAEFAFDGGDCAQTGECGPGQIKACDGSCMAEWQIGDGMCNPELDCAEFAFDGGDCQTAQGPCDPTMLEIETCLGTCMSPSEYAAYMTNGTCDPELDCELFVFDGGVCTPTDGCPPGQGEDCLGQCLDAADIVAKVGNGTCDVEFNCAAFVFDGLDCESTSCNSWEMADCLGGCTHVNWYGDNQCDVQYYCEALNWDDGDCIDTCPYTQVQDCLGACHDTDEGVGNGVCDPHWQCTEHDMDGGDCEGALCAPTDFVCTSDGLCLPMPLVCNGIPDCAGGEDEDEAACGSSSDCKSYEVENCEGGCTLASWLGDSQCDSELNCAETQWDGGACVGTCPYDEFMDCLGTCHVSYSDVGDGVCQPEWNCVEHVMDGGDCATATCAATEFLCIMDSVCLPKSVLCDGMPDCMDGQDELDCDPGSMCATYEVANCEGGCTIAAWQGDGQCDSVLNCAETQWDGGDCVDACPYDEFKDCMGACHESDADLGNGICDDNWNCAEHSYDKTDCWLTECGPSDFICNGGAICLSPDKVCDGYPDCMTGEDEEGCEEPSLCASYEVENCEGSCTLEAWLGDGDCDTKLDCAETSWDGGDCLAIECAVTELMCTDGACKPLSAKCDGIPDCSDGSDEVGCAIDEGPCLDGELQGCTGTCYTQMWFGDGHCDSFLNCAETGWDVGDCDASGASCTPGQFECIDGSCKAIGWQCDGEEDCAQGEDEFGCPVEF